ncbi:hypothetical protein GCM10007173_13330 [Glutamicibacter ardleyensis]|uniref:Uncharacterized protein n=1 Tax=Glutamicibacter ardleyensis TaxID=225894 RepID=A0ABQ2DHJ1_9MICC|nr:hypothetical protein GCM10007173_13330 [Glutamicibacter ardleyensis]
MTPLELLEAHQFEPGYLCNSDNRCKCGYLYNRGYGGNQSLRQRHDTHLAHMIDNHMQEREAKMRQLIRDLTDPGKCWFDHNGGCQEHGYLTLEPGELCPHAEATQLLGDETE